jgi:hypothetical protein
MTGILVLAGSVLVAASARSTDGGFRPCSLLTSGEIESVQGEPVIAAKESRPERGPVAVSQCFYTVRTFSKSVSLEITRPRRDGRKRPRELWGEMFGYLRERRREPEEGEKSSPPRKIAGIGDDAYWVGSDFAGGLYVLKGDAWFRVSVGGPEREAVKVEKLKKLARRAVARL